MKTRVCGASLAGVLFVLAAVTATASAKPCDETRTPGGVSEADEYSEVIPGPCGDETTRDGPGDADGPSQGAVPQGTVQQLESQGAEGKNAAELASATTPGGGGQASGGGSGNGPGAGGQDGVVAGGSVTAASGGGALSGILEALGGDSGSGGGLGVLLPIALAATLLAGVAIWRVRRSTEADSGGGSEA
jgi:hypothetical protein